MLKPKEKILNEKIDNAIANSDIETIKSEIIKLSKDKSKITKITDSFDNFPDLKDIKSFYDIVSLLKESIKMDNIKSELGLSDLSDNVKETLERTDIYQAYVFYIWNAQNRNIKIIPLPNMNPLMDLVKMREIYLLHRPALFIDNKPIYIIVKNIPFSFELQFIDKENLEGLLKLKIPSATEVRAILKSIYVISIFGKPLFTMKHALIIILLLTTTHLIHFLIQYFMMIGG